LASRSNQKFDTKRKLCSMLIPAAESENQITIEREALERKVFIGEFTNSREAVKLLKSPPGDISIKR